MNRKICLSLILCLIFVFQTSGCKEKQEISVREVKEEPGQAAVPASVAFEQSKVAANLNAGFVDMVEPQRATLNTKIHIGGWAADPKKMTPAKAVITVVDGKQAFVPIQTGLTREDVAKAHKNDNLTKSGWDGVFNAGIMGKGKHKLEVYALMNDGKFVPLEYRGKKYCEVEVAE